MEIMGRSNSLDILEEDCVKEYLSMQKPSFMKRNKHYALAKALNLLLDITNAKSVKEALEYCRNNNNLHKILSAYINQLQKENKAPKTIKFYLSLLTSFLDFHDIEYQRALRKVKNRPKAAPIRIDRIPTTAELQKLILSTKSPRLRMLIQLLAQTGMRLNEALHLRVEYIDLENNKIILPGTVTKNGNRREIPIIPELREELEKYIKKHKISGWLFPNARDPSKPANPVHVYQTYHKLLKRLSLDERDQIGYKLHLHNLRKWFKTQLEIAGVNGLLIETWMGHSTGIQGFYFRPSHQDIQKEVKKMAEALTIFGKREVEEKLEKDIQDLRSKYNLLLTYLRMGKVPAPMVTVIREGEEEIVPIDEVNPTDIIVTHKKDKAINTDPKTKEKLNSS